MIFDFVFIYFCISFGALPLSITLVRVRVIAGLSDSSPLGPFALGSLLGLFKSLDISNSWDMFPYW